MATGLVNALMPSFSTPTLTPPFVTLVNPSRGHVEGFTLVVSTFNKMNHKTEQLHCNKCSKRWAPQICITTKQSLQPFSDTMKKCSKGMKINKIAFAFRYCFIVYWMNCIKVGLIFIVRRKYPYSKCLIKYREFNHGLSS